MSDTNVENCPPKTVLVVDDHILFREGLVSLFNSFPEYTVVGEAGNVFEAVETAKYVQPDIVMMDFFLPDGNGVDATKAILSFAPDCTIVFLTAYEEDQVLFEAIRSGAKGYLPKHIAGPKLISSLKALENDEIAINRKMASRIIEEFSHSQKEVIQQDEIVSKLTPREMDIIQELVPGITNQQIAIKLHISENTVKHHLRNIMTKLEVDNRQDASLIAQKAGIVD